MKTSDRKKFVAFLALMFHRVGVAQQEAAACAEALADQFTMMAMPVFKPGVMGYMSPIKHWVIRDQDLQLAQSAVVSACSASSGVLGVLADTKNAAPLAGIAILGALAKVAHNACTKGAVLESFQYRVLATLKDRGPLTSPDLWRVIAGQGFDALSEADILGELTALQAVRLRDGTVVPFVAKDGAGLWSAAGV